ncbi:MAG: AraC family transcriptional regulator [Abditibacteriota bacterium]|nr:AraC family transcriptional regulator [Abditibacteriota bacterium]
MIFSETLLTPAIKINAVHTAFIKTYSHYVFLGETHPMWELSYFLSGECIVTTGAGVFRTRPGMLVLHSPWLLHGMNAENGSVSIMTVSFTGDGLSEFLSAGSKKAGEKEKKLLSLLEQEIARPEHAPAGLTLIKALLEALLIEMKQEESAVTEPKPLSQDAQIFSEMVGYMEQNITRQIRLGELERVAGHCATSVRNIFHRFAGMSPTDYFSALRASYAVSLLEKGMSVTDVSYEMSFSSPGYFSNFFKKRTGVSPMEYKKGGNGLPRPRK